ncbi:MAG: hypothetical protein E7774_12680 [Bradyrhizobium sp.]|nr:MAG: hypothetical protein E7774_12680 [Bradyrhizobium sp.]
MEKIVEQRRPRPSPAYREAETPRILVSRAAAPRSSDWAFILVVSILFTLGVIGLALEALHGHR